MLHFKENFLSGKKTKYDKLEKQTALLSWHLLASMLKYIFTSDLTSLAVLFIESIYRIVRLGDLRGSPRFILVALDRNK